MERTFVMIKPDAVKRGLIGEIIKRFETRGFNILTMKKMKASKELAEKHYAVHRGKPFFASVVNFIISGDVVPMVLEGENAVAAVRQMMGATDPLNAAPGSIRGDFALVMEQNLIHGSDGPETAEYEINLWFPGLKD